MASNNIPETIGVSIGQNRYAYVVFRDGDKWVEVYQTETLPNGQWIRSLKVSTLAADQPFSPGLIITLPRLIDSEIPSDFYMPQGEITAQMYQVFDPRFKHSALAITKRINYWKARRFAHNINAWLILDGEKGLLAQFPDMSVPNFFSWAEFENAMNNRFPAKQEKLPERKLLVIIQNSNQKLLEDAYEDLIKEREKLMQELKLTDLSILRGDLDFCLEELKKPRDYVVSVILERDTFLSEQAYTSVLVAGATNIFNFPGNRASDLAGRLRECVWMSKLERE